MMIVFSIFIILVDDVFFLKFHNVTYIGKEKEKEKEEKIKRFFFQKSWRNRVGCSHNKKRLGWCSMYQGGDVNCACCNLH